MGDVEGAKKATKSSFLKARGQFAIDLRLFQVLANRTDGLGRIAGVMNGMQLYLQ